MKKILRTLFKVHNREEEARFALVQACGGDINTIAYVLDKQATLKKGTK